MQASKRVVFNTGILYAKMLVTVVVSLFSTRVILNALGASDFGLFNVIAGVIGVLAFLNSAMATSTQRYLSVSMGSGDVIRLKKVFANSVILHLVIGLLLIVLFEVAGLYFIENKLKILPERLDSAKIVFHFAVISTFFSIISVPYDAVVTAHENMLFVVIVDILDSLFRLAIAYYLLFTSAQDKLLIFGFLVMLSSILIRGLKRAYCFRNYNESRVNLRREYDLGTIRELSSFAGWNLFGAMCSIFRNQGVAVVLNMFFGTIVNAAYGIANQINSQLMFFSQSMMRTIRPQMMKSEGAGERSRMLRLSIVAGKFSFFLFSFFLIPLYIEMPWVLKVWLKNVPDNTIIFCQLILLMSLIRQLSMGIMSAVQSIGKVRAYQSIAGTIQLLTIPIGYLFLYLQYPAYSILVVAIALEVLATVFRVYYFGYLTSFPLAEFLKKVIVNPIIAFLIAFSASFLVHYSISEELVRVVAVFLCSGFIYAGLIYFMGVDAQEKKYFNSIGLSIKLKICGRSGK